ncbi:MAG TPA: hypothetical protein VJT33_03975 [bacterium]|nr:hypothetical protein [bacterium]
MPAAAGRHVQVAVALVQSSEWASLRTRILRALEPYLEAKLAVVAAISEVSPNGHGPRG